MKTVLTTIVTLAVMLVGCPNPTPNPPVPPTPDSEDSGPAPCVGACPQPTPPKPVPPLTTCGKACAALGKLECPMGLALDCVDFMNTMNTAADHRNPVTGKAMTCADVAAVTTVSQVKAIGFTCQ